MSNKKNTIANQRRDLLKEWDYEKNVLLCSPDTITIGSGKKVWWKCSKGHSWQAAIYSRVNGNNCPYCSNQKIFKGYNDLATTDKELIKEWDFERNTILPTEIGSGSTKTVWWKCINGHSYKAQVQNRTGNQKCGCPYCSIPAKKLLTGFNDLQTKYPELSKEWHPTKNGSLTPDSVLCGTDKKVWWKCKNGHAYEQKVVSRVHGSNCPYCSHQKILVGYNDFATEHPELLNEWDYEKNDCSPKEVMSQSRYKAWWKCPFGHSYQAWLSNRCGKTRSGCPICDKENHTSFPEQALFFYVKKVFPDAVNSDKTAIGMELDIYIPSRKTAIEYDGKNWHNNNKYEEKKNLVCKEKGVSLFRIREIGLQLYDNCYCLVRDDPRSDVSLSKAIEELLNALGKTIDVDVNRDSALIYESYIVTRKSHSLKNEYPEIANEWHPTKNGNLTAEMVSPMTNKKVWWLGKCGHEWQMSVQDRTDQNCGCPICSGKRIVSGINDLLTKYPVLCEEWDYEKNGKIGLYPDKVAPHSDKKAWWKCKTCGNTWFSKIDGRTGMNAGCPKCGIRTVSELKHKSVKCLETGRVYSSLKEAEINTGINRVCISNCCKRKQKTAGKFHWVFM